MFCFESWKLERFCYGDLESIGSCCNFLEVIVVAVVVWFIIVSKIYGLLEGAFGSVVEELMKEMEETFIMPPTARY